MARAVTPTNTTKAVTMRHVSLHLDAHIQHINTMDIGGHNKRLFSSTNKQWAHSINEEDHGAIESSTPKTTSREKKLSPTTAKEPPKPTKVDLKNTIQLKDLKMKGRNK